jgi:hypothetical protein
VLIPKHWDVVLRVVAMSDPNKKGDYNIHMHLRRPVFGILNGLADSCTSLTSLLTAKELREAPNLAVLVDKAIAKWQHWLDLSAVELYGGGFCFAGQAVKTHPTVVKEVYQAYKRDGWYLSDKLQFNNGAL